MVSSQSVPEKFTEIDQTSYLSQTEMNIIPEANIYTTETVPSFSPFPGEFGSRRNAAHTAFLTVRQQGLQQFSGIIGSIYPKHPETSNPLDNNSGGLFASQGAGMFVLKRLDDANRDITANVKLSAKKLQSSSCLLLKKLNYNHHSNISLNRRS